MIEGKAQITQNLYTDQVYFTSNLFYIFPYANFFDVVAYLLILVT